MYLLDTHIFSDLRNPGHLDSKLRAWAAQARLQDLHISVVTLVELERGVLLIQRGDRIKGARLRAWLDTHVVEPFRQRTLPIDIAIARRSAALHAPYTRTTRDALIAATALVHGLMIVTRNVTDFECTGVSLLNPWHAPYGA